MYGFVIATVAQTPACLDPEWPVRITPYYTTLEIDEIAGVYRDNGFVDIRNGGAAVIPVLEEILLIGTFE